MTAQKTRRPGSIADALTRIIGDMTAEDAGAAIGKSANLVRKWSDPDCDTWPNVLQALELDIAYTEAGHGTGVLTFYLRELYREHFGHEDHSPMCPTVRQLHVTREVGDVSDAVLALRDLPELTQNQFDAADREIHEAIAELNNLRRDLRAKTPKLHERKPVIVAQNMQAAE